MRYILIPVKDLSRAKQRLAALMTQEERTRLAWAMLEVTLAGVAQVRNVDRIAVVTSYLPAVEIAGHYGMEVIAETEQLSESASVDFGLHQIERNGASAALRLPADLPLITAEDVEQILADDAPEPSAVLVPSRDGTGTNAILRRPATLFPSHFGPGSLAKHLAEAEHLNANCKIVLLESIALDLDDPSDIAELMRREQPTPIRDLLMKMGIEERLRRE